MRIQSCAIEWNEKLKMDTHTSHVVFEVWPGFGSRSEFFALTLITHLLEKVHIISCSQREFQPLQKKGGKQDMLRDKQTGKHDKQTRYNSPKKDIGNVLHVPHLNIAIKHK